MSDSRTVLPRTPKRIGVAADHGGFESKEDLVGMLREAQYEVVDFGDRRKLAVAVIHRDFEGLRAEVEFERTIATRE